MLVPVNRSIPLDTWIVIFENKTLNREWVSNWLTDKSAIYGSFLSFWSIVLNLFVCLVIILGNWRGWRGKNNKSEDKNCTQNEIKNFNEINKFELGDKGCPIAAENYIIKNSSSSQTSNEVNENQNSPRTKEGSYNSQSSRIWPEIRQNQTAQGSMGSPRNDNISNHNNNAILTNLQSSNIYQNQHILGNIQPDSLLKKVSNLRQNSNASSTTTSSFGSSVGCKVFVEEEIQKPAKGRVLLTLNFSLVQILIAGLIIPASLITNSRGSWVLGMELCRVWLILQVLCMAATFWTMVLATLDCVLQEISPKFYSQFFGRKMALVTLTSCWLFSLMSIFPLAFSVNAPGDVIVESLCAVTLSRDDTVVLAVSAFIFPASLCFAGTVALGANQICNHLKNRYQNIESVSQSNVRILDSENGSISGTDGSWRSNSWNRDEMNSIRSDPVFKPNQHPPSTKSGDRHALRETSQNAGSKVALVSVSLVSNILWLPFFVAYLLMPFCADMCVSPVLWTVMIWVGYTTTGLTPLLWFLEESMRRKAVSLTGCFWAEKKEKLHQDFPAREVKSAKRYVYLK